jgi:hypothetical protein
MNPFLFSDQEETKDVDMDTEKRDELEERKVSKRKILIDIFSFVEEDDEDNLVMPGAGPIAMHASNRDDPLLEIQDDVKIISFNKIIEIYDMYI